MNLTATVEAMLRHTMREYPGQDERHGEFLSGRITALQDVLQLLWIKPYDTGGNHG